MGLNVSPRVAIWYNEPTNLMYNYWTNKQSLNL